MKSLLVVLLTSGVIFAQVCPLRSAEESRKDVSFKAIAIAKDGSIYVAGYKKNEKKDDVVVKRVLSNGKVDKDFGDAGVMKGNAGLNTISPYGLGVDGNGDVYMAGRTGVESDWFTDSRSFAAKFSSEGKFDPSFGKNGFVIVPRAQSSYAKTLGWNEKGDLFVAGQTVRGASESFVFSLTKSGQLNSSFGKGGMDFHRYSQIESFTFTDEGQLLVFGDQRIGVSVDPIDKSYGSLRGFGAMLYEKNKKAHQKKVLKINLRGGGCTYPKAVKTGKDEYFFVGDSDNNGRLAIIKFKTQPYMNVDRSFGVFGARFHQLPGYKYHFANDIAADKNGLYLQLTGIHPDDGTKKFLVRFTKKGDLDPSFGNEGVVEIEQSNYIKRLVLDAEGRPVVVGQSAIGRYTVEGELDKSFGVGGWTSLK